MSLGIGDMIEVVDVVRGLDDYNRYYELFPGDCGLVVETDNGPHSFLGVMIAGQIIYIPDCCIKKAFS